jgi:hypothetical protein
MSDSTRIGDNYECDCGFIWHTKHGPDCASCECERLQLEILAFKQMRENHLEKTRRHNALRYAAYCVYGRPILGE